MSSHEFDVIAAPSEYELEAKFDFLLKSAAARLEQCGIADDFTHEASNIPFGNLRDGRLMYSHTIDRGYDYGVISFLSDSTPSHNFILRNLPTDPYGWSRERGRPLAPRIVMNLLEREWPTDADRELLDTLLNLVDHESTKDKPIHVEPGVILHMLELYHDPTDSSDENYIRTWDYHDATVNMDTGKPRIESIRLTSYDDGNGDLREVHADIIIPYEFDGTSTPLVCRIHSGTLGDVSITAAYVNPYTSKEVPVEIKNLAGVYDELALIIDKMLTEKAVM